MQEPSFQAKRLEHKQFALKYFANVCGPHLMCSVTSWSLWSRGWPFNRSQSEVISNRRRWKIEILNTLLFCVILLVWLLERVATVVSFQQPACDKWTGSFLHIWWEPITRHLFHLPISQQVRVNPPQVALASLSHPFHQRTYGYSSASFSGRMSRPWFFETSFLWLEMRSQTQQKGDGPGLWLWHLTCFKIEMLWAVQWN